jgi:hypothetical protein
LLRYLCLGPSGLSNLRVSVPSIVLRGETTSFNCSWDQDPKDKVSNSNRALWRVSVSSIVLTGETASLNCNWDQDPIDKVSNSNRALWRVSVSSIVLTGETASLNCNWDQDPIDKVSNNIRTPCEYPYPVSCSEERQPASIGFPILRNETRCETKWILK